MPCESTWITNALSGSPVDWPEDIEDFANRVLEYAAAHGVTSLLHHVLFPSKIWLTLPELFRQTLSKHARNQAAHELLVQRELTRVFQEFSEQDLRFLGFKGTALAYTHYPVPHLRERCDTDIVFSSEDQAEHARHLLKVRGYTRPNAIYS